MRKVGTFLLLFCAGLLHAQLPSSPPPVTAGDPTALARLQMEFLAQSLRDGSRDLAYRQEATREAQIENTRFMIKANHFVQLWENFADSLNGKRTFDAKLAKKLSKAFHDLERSDGWPIR